MAANLDKMLRFIDDYQQQHPHYSSIQVVRSLRAYSREGYADIFWANVAGSNAAFVSEELDDLAVVLMGQSIDFAHFMTALSNQTRSGIRAIVKDSVLRVTSKAMTGRTNDAQEYTAAIKDTAQAIDTYLNEYGPTTYKPEALNDFLTQFASDQYYASDLVAFSVSRLLYQNAALSVREAILEASWFNYSDTVQRYLIETLGAKVSRRGYLINGVQVRQQIYERILTYLTIKRDIVTGHMLNRTYRKNIRPALIDHASDYFIQYLQRSLVYHHQELDS
ncbi:MAG: hypothetical protein AAF821_10750 [Cyanobacteria bacterium P01_D01_bin.156]